MFTWICGFVCDCKCIGFLLSEEEDERNIKYNEKDTFTPIFNGEKGEVGNGGLTEVIS